MNDREIADAIKGYLKNIYPDIKVDDRGIILLVRSSAKQLSLKGKDNEYE